ncbi:hypothetical protein [Brevundimonas sp.]
MRIRMGGYHSMANGVSDVADPLQFRWDRSTIQAIFQPTPSKEKVADKSH